jgi:alpha-L-fucosidase
MVADPHRLDWWREARFGMFIHWGLYAIPAGVWKGLSYPGASEWLMYSAKIRPQDYAPLLGQFNPERFDAREWVRTAKSAGMKYVVVTSKHHDGFALWHTKQSDWHVGNTPFRRDVLKELSEACHEEGMRFCLYHSILDWNHPDYLPRQEWDDRPADEADFDRYVDFMKAQLAELLGGDYGGIGVLWFDGEWEDTWTHDRGKDLYEYVRSLQPDIIVNNRVDKGRNGMAGITQGDFLGDYDTPEQQVPEGKLYDVDWESCMTMNDSWGFHQNDHNWKSADTLIRQLVDCASKGGNYLLNVGPDSDGRIPQPSLARFEEIGEWMGRYGRAIYKSSPLPTAQSIEWGRITYRPGRLFLHVFDREADSIYVPGFRRVVEDVRELATDEEVQHRLVPGGGVEVLLPALREGIRVYRLEYAMALRGD